MHTALQHNADTIANEPILSIIHPCPPICSSRSTRRCAITALARCARRGAPGGRCVVRHFYSWTGRNRERVERVLPQLAQIANEMAYPPPVGQKNTAPCATPPPRARPRPAPAADSACGLSSLSSPPSRWRIIRLGCKGLRGAFRQSGVVVHAVWNLCGWPVGRKSAAPSAT